MWSQMSSIYTPGFQDLIAKEVLSEDAPVSQMANAMSAIDPDWVEAT